MLTLTQCCFILCCLLATAGIGLASTIFMPVNPFYQMLLMENPAFPWIHFVIYCVYAIIGLFGIVACRQPLYSKAKIYTIASWAFLLLAIPWDITDLVMANELQNHAHNYCYGPEAADLKSILEFDITCEDIRIAPPIVGVVTILLLLLKLYFGATIIGWTIRLRNEETQAEIVEESYEPSWMYDNKDEDIMQHYFQPVKRY